MRPYLITDKSTFQYFSKPELNILAKHYLLVVTPELIMEILGDLEKPERDKALSEKEVMELSKKLLDCDPVFTLRYEDLCVLSLLGRELPRIGESGTIGIPFKTSKGETILFFDEPKQRKILLDWANGNFSEKDKIGAYLWKDRTTSIPLEIYKEIFKDSLSEIRKVKNLDNIASSADYYILKQDPALQFSFLSLFMNGLRLPQDLKDDISKRWMNENLPMLMHFAPYAGNVFRTKLIFILGLTAGFLSTKSNTLIDLLYLFYLPYCMIFSSGDKTHVKLCPLFLTDEQKFIPRETLRAELSRLAKEN